MRNETILGWVIVLIMLCALAALIYYLSEYTSVSQINNFDFTIIAAV